jgi:hypothetical protein
MERFTRQPSGGDKTQGNAAPASTPAAPKSVASSVGAPTFASKLLVVSLIVVSVLIILTLALNLFTSAGGSDLVKEDKYQAVFLDNGQVYFGKLANINSAYVELTDIFYLQVEQQVQPDQVEAGADAQDTAQPSISLAKLGNELHGPEDQMFISREKIVFWENLKDDGQVVTAITDFKTGENDGN